MAALIVGSLLILAFALCYLLGSSRHEPRCKEGVHRLAARHDRTPLDPKVAESLRLTVERFYLTGEEKRDMFFKLLDQSDRATYVCDVCQDCGKTWDPRQAVQEGLRLLEEDRKRAELAQEEIRRLLNEGTG